MSRRGRVPRSVVAAVAATGQTQREKRAGAAVAMAGIARANGLNTWCAATSRLVGARWRSHFRSKPLPPQVIAGDGDEEM